MERDESLPMERAEVVFSVDCTKLKDYFSPEERQFNCIYFNFPHCGRKAGVVKNRELLAHFFRSSAEVLAEEGEVHVALCNGQGGTPADQPRREWHNSWQIVAVAAGAGFILSDVHPFNAETIHGYKCTGYRSQDKAFCVEGALNHIFTRSTPLLCFSPRSCRIQLENQKVSFQVPQVLVDKINRGFLEPNSNHPVRTVKEELAAGLSQAFPVQDTDSCLPLLHQGHLEGVCPSSIFWITLSPEETPSPEEMSPGPANGPVLFSCADFCQGTEKNVPEGRHSPEQFYLRPSLLPHAQAIMQEGAFFPGTLRVLSGPVFRKCRVTPHSMPVFHEVLIVFAVSRGTESSCVQMLVNNITSTIHSLQQTGTKPNINLQEATSSETTELSDFAAFESQLGKIQYWQVWAPEGSTAFKCLISARFCAALLSNISDCDETFNYWEPTHYLIYGKGFQTWEYSPAYAIRSYAYLWLHALPAWFHARVLQTNKVLIFYFLRCFLAFLSCICELYFYK
ncbi:ferredoxin-fold anticodon-binding domain-containing protein 1 [Manacus vitellinus]|uniref:ferredoxin-fold anticodon-binding domain-containing protein 1 n=1 Tax=Manacus vitellinus TaxID=328815 RepID=UPI00115E5522|nr:ferredoxin-fold anticodon-binding domain-containing protein 1 [Manacus vitellinus]